MRRKHASSGKHVVVCGIHVVVETLRAEKRQVEHVYVARGIADDSELGIQLERRRVPVSQISIAELKSLTGTARHQGVAARVGPFPYVSVEAILASAKEGHHVLLMLDEVQDPANLGSILRAAECLGAAGVLLAKDRSVSITSTVEKASAGASSHLPVARVVNLVRAIEAFKGSGFWVYAADSNAQESCYSVDLTGKIVLVLGSEGRGLRRLVKERCDKSIHIPMAGKIASLNVAQTAAILLAEVFRQSTAVPADGQHDGS